MRVGYPEDSLAAFRLQQFSSDTLWQGLQLEIDAEYQDFNEVYQELGNAILRVQYFFPELNTPNIVCFNSGFNIAVYPHKEFIGLGLEWFLNPESRYVKMLPPNNFPLYKRQGMDKKYIAYDAVKGWLLNRMYNDYYFNKDLLHEMVFYGKVMLVLEQAFPQAKIEDLFKLEEERMRWAEDNMHGVWKHIVSKNQLFSTNAREINKYVMDGPFTNEFGSESAPRLGWIIGWQMLKDYADEHDNLTLKEIVEQKNEQDILKSFNPKSFNK
ncbi:hypothetical protein FRX97_06640 [Luteibaculum oceani]|uniref:DUF2268 domain-containing protein n=2 Tax=Luteibaculum oceani TaxID=1294296 RepID=A0A5C6V303_9FLAO|nr:hypothetical protein FRX97_06640 [Luteibaculum oceani]